MSMLKINKLIQSERIKQGLSQEELAYNICSTSTLSRIERGIHFPKKTILIKLLDKLYDFSNITYNPKREQLAKDINYYLDIENYHKILPLKKELEKIPLKSINYSQFIGMCDVYIDFFTNNTLDTTILTKKIKSLLEYSIKYYNENSKLNFYLSNVEANLIFLLAKVKENENDISTAITIITSLQHCLQTKSCYISEAFYIKILKNQLHMFIKTNNYIKIIKSTDVGIKYCSEHSYTSDLLYFKFYNALYRYSQSPNETLSNQITSIYYSYIAINEEIKAKEIKKIAENEFNYKLNIS